MFATFETPGGKKSTTAVAYAVWRALIQIFILPIADRFHCKRPNPPIKRAKLMIIDRSAQAKIVEEGCRRIELLLIVHRIDPKIVNVRLSEACHLQTHKALYANNLRLFVGIVHLLGKTPVLMTQPLGHRSVGQDDFNALLRSVAAETATSVIDLDQLMATDREWAYLFDKIHFNNRGSAAVGQIIATALPPLLMWPAPSLGGSTH